MALPLTPTAGNSKDVEIAVSLIYFSNFWKTFDMSLINCKINVMLTWSANYVIANLPSAGAFAITDKKLGITVLTL